MAGAQFCGRRVRATADGCGLNFSGLACEESGIRCGGRRRGLIRWKISAFLAVGSDVIRRTVVNYSVYAGVL